MHVQAQPYAYRLEREIPARRFPRKRKGILIAAAVLTIASLLILNFVRWKMIGSETEQSLQVQQTQAFL